MTSIAQIITDAYQTSNLVALSVIPNADEQEKALRHTNRLFKSLFGYEIGDRLTDATLSSAGLTYATTRPYLTATSFNIDPNTRVISPTTLSTTLYMPENPEGGTLVSFVDLSGLLSTAPITINGSKRLVEGVTSLLLNTNSENVQWFYRDDLANWQRVTSLALADEFPLPEEFEELFISLLVLRLSPSEGLPLDDQIGYLMRQMLRKLRSRYSQSFFQSSELGLQAINPRNRGRFFNYA